MAPRPRTKWWKMNPWDVEPDFTEEDVWCEKCDMIISAVETKWMPGENVGTCVCPVCDSEIEVIPDDCV